MELDLGPFSFRCFATRDGHTRYQLAFVTNRTGGDAYRESTLEASVRSDHLLEAVGRQNPADSFTDPTPTSPTTASSARPRRVSTS
jgi:hypothetical protein